MSGGPLLLLARGRTEAQSEMYGRQEAAMPDWKRELLRKKRTMHKAFPSWAALAAGSGGDRTVQKAVHLGDAARVPAGLVCPQSPRGGGPPSMGEDKGGQAELESSEDHEWQYGPGFVDRLRCKFLSLSLREPSGLQQPLRAYASVENLLEPKSSVRPTSAPKPAFQRARSMETLLDPLINEDVVIVERSSTTASELPRPDIVRTCKRIFEASADNRRPLRRRPPVLRARAPLRADKENNQPLARPRPARPVANIKPLRKQDEPPPVKEDEPPLKAPVAVTRPERRDPAPGPLWPQLRQASPAATSVVFDFRGKDVKPHVAVTRAPCGSPLDSDELDSSDEPLPFPSGIVFVGENVVVGGGALLTTRNKKLKIQFNDSALVTIEYAAEECHSPRGNGHDVDAPTVNGRNCGGSLGSYTPSALSSGEAFQLGLCRPSRPLPAPETPAAPEPEEPAPATAWSLSATSSDLLF
ncbi:uncharacterized protein LOC119406440 [Rhipicephalus sanguineus]|uniref:Uncharacterized protein n=1 Tax=Rhipicephalus sanguineus TaxID=34632 RepID=A0A9D4YPE8_RHISA|nr:uncharacterized protein LOC119406440 [Rhipicephalus sanguineus]KAH7983473.1 hypothetical protein HPB52_012287 [Rhipicephalus sanguineus]